MRRTVGGTARKIGSTRTLSDVEALKQLGDCVRASARKRMNQYAGRTPGPGGILGSAGMAFSSGGKAFSRVTLDFERMIDPLHGDRSAAATGGMRIFVKDTPGRRRSPSLREESMDGNESTGAVLFGTVRAGTSRGVETMDDLDLPSADDEPPPSPSPSPRPTSAMSRRGLTPVLSSFHPAASSLSGMINSKSEAEFHRPISFHQRPEREPVPATSIFTQTLPATGSTRKPKPDVRSIFTAKGEDWEEDKDATPRAPSKRGSVPIFTLSAPKRAMDVDQNTASQSERRAGRDKTEDEKKYDELEERLKRFMRDLDKVDQGLAEVKARVSTPT